MTDSQCMGRLLASATHDMRNVLAVIRESAGLAQDMVQLAAGADKPADPRVIKALKEAQQQILRGAALAECMEYLAQVSHSENENAPCDLARVAGTFCLMAARRARAVQMVLESADSEEPVWSAVPALAVLRGMVSAPAPEDRAEEAGAAEGSGTAYTPFGFSSAKRRTAPAAACASSS